MMAVDFTNPGSLVALGALIRKKRESIGWTQEKLANQAGYSDKIIRLIEHGARTKLQTLQNVCQALGLPVDTYELSDNKIADAKYGSYNLIHYIDHIGIYYGFRRGLSVQTNFLRTIYEIAWSEKKRCLEFFEDQRYMSSAGRMVDFSQHGDIYISNEEGLLHLLTSDKGALRLITLSRLRRDDNVLQGAVLTQLRNALHYSPAVSPIYLQKAEALASRSEVASLIGPIPPTHELYSTVAACIEEVEREVAYFPPTSSLDPKVTRISSRMSKPRRA
jgi:transcriptional regulator with XRE-family HTH domain